MDNRWLVLIVLYMLLSVCWSDVPQASFKRWIMEFEVLVMALVIVSEPFPREAMESVLRRTVYVLIPFSVLLIKYFPHLGVAYGRWSGAYMWVGVALQKNSLGRLCVIALFFLLWTLVRRWQGNDVAAHRHQTAAELLLVGATGWLLKGPTIQAYSATAVLSLGAGIGTYCGLLFMRKRNNFGGLGILLIPIVIGIGYGTAAPFIKGSDYGKSSVMSEQPISTLGRDAGFTGRVEIWAGLLPEVAQRPILGSGYDSFWTPENIVIHEINSSHNGYLDLLLNLGTIGLLLAIGLVLSASRMAFRTIPHDFDWGVLLICFVVMLVTHSISESSINSFYNPLTATVVFLVAVVSHRVTPQESKAHQGAVATQAFSFACVPE